MRYDDWHYEMFMLQGHNGELMTIKYTVSRDMVDHIESDELGTMLASYCATMDRKMLDACGHVDQNRVWFSGDHVRRPNWNRQYPKVWLLDGPMAGKQYETAPTRNLLVMNQYNAEDYRVHDVAGMRVGVWQETSVPSLRMEM